MRILRVQGKGNVSKEPDMVTLSFEVESLSMDYEESLNNLNAQVEDLRKNMEASGLDRVQLKTAHFNLDLKSSYEKNRYVFKGYGASHRMIIEIPMDKTLLNKVIRNVAQGHSGATIDISFSVRDKEALRKSVLIQAVQTARMNAEILASSAGVKLGKLMEMDYGHTEVHFYDHQEVSMCMSESLSCDVDIEPQDVRAADNVTLVYEIVD